MNKSLVACIGIFLMIILSSCTATSKEQQDAEKTMNVRATPYPSSTTTAAPETTPSNNLTIPSIEPTPTPTQSTSTDSYNAPHG